MIRVRTSRDLDLVEKEDVVVASQLTEGMAEKINSRAKTVWTTKRFFSKHKRLFGRMDVPVKIRDKRVRRCYRELKVFNRTYKACRRFKDRMIVRPVASLLYSGNPEDALVLEVVTHERERSVASPPYGVFYYSVTKAVYDFIKNRSEIVVLTNPDFKEKTRVFVPCAEDAIQLELNIQTIVSLSDVASQLKALKKEPKFALPFNKLIAEDWYNVVKKGRKPRVIFNPFKKKLH